MAKKVKKIMKVYLDNCCFNRPFDDQKQIRIRLETEAKLFIQEKILNKNIELVWSYILEYENEFNPFDERKNIIKEWKNFSVKDIEENKQILEESNRLKEIGLSSKDALHVACAVYAKSDFFITTDDDLEKKLKDYNKITIINPIAFLKILEE